MPLPLPKLPELMLMLKWNTPFLPAYNCCSLCGYSGFFGSVSRTRLCFFSMLQQFSNIDKLLGKEGHFRPPMPTSPASANTSVKKRNAISRATGGISQPIMKGYNKTEGTRVQEREKKKWKRGGLSWRKIQWQAFFPLLHLNSAEINAWGLRSAGVGYCPGNAFAHCTPLCLLRRNSEGICFLLFHEPHAFTLTEVDTHQLATSITAAGWENSWLYLDPADPAWSLTEKLCSCTVVRNAAGQELRTPRLKEPDAFWIKHEWFAEGAPGARPHPGSPQLGWDSPERFAWRAFSLLCFCHLLKEVLQRGRRLW